MVILSPQDLSDLDELYTERDSAGRPVSWGTLVRELRKLRRTIESGEVLRVHGGAELHTVLDFHTWAYAQYKLLEEGYDDWIGNDD